jgi:hypothetical protein
MRLVLLSLGFFLLVALVTVVPSWAQVSEPEPFFSEYVEGADGKDGARGDGDDALEIFNPTDLQFDLAGAGCVLLLYENGASPPLELSFGQTDPIPPHDGLVIASGAATDPDLLAAANLVLPTLSFDGNDALQLVCYELLPAKDRYLILDAIGVPGDPPGAWTAYTTNMALSKIPPADPTGDPWGSDSFDPSAWNDTPSGDYDYSDLGDYVPVELLSFSIE